jgi:hypothetical protein
VLADSSVVRTILDQAEKTSLAIYDIESQRVKPTADRITDLLLPLARSFGFLQSFGVIPGETIIIDGRRTGALFVPITAAGGVLWHILEEPVRKEMKQWLYLFGYTRFSDGMKRGESEAFCRQHPRCTTRLYLLENGHLQWIEPSDHYTDFIVVERRRNTGGSDMITVHEHWSLLGSASFSSVSGALFTWDLFAPKSGVRVSSSEVVSSVS